MYEKLDTILNRTIIVVLAVIFLTIGGFGLAKLIKIQNNKEPFWVEMTNATSTQAVVSTSTEPIVPTKPAPTRDESESRGEVVASKTGKVYYLPTCAGAKRIKQENQKWFMTAALAKAAGLTPSTSCKGLE